MPGRIFRMQRKVNALRPRTITGSIESHPIFKAFPQLTQSAKKLGIIKNNTETKQSISGQSRNTLG